MKKMKKMKKKFFHNLWKLLIFPGDFNTNLPEHGHIYKQYCCTELIQNLWFAT